MTPLDALGWTATGVFVASYLARDARTLRLLQAGGALLWLAYGVLLNALPVIVANAIVAGAAAYSSFAAAPAPRQERRAEHGGTPGASGA
jgi:hypothetical protein